MFLAVLISDLISLQSACPDSSSMLYWGLNISLHDTLLSSMFYLIIRGMATWQWQYILEADTLHSCAKCCLLLVSSSDSLVPDWLTFNDAASITISLLSLMHNNHSCFGVGGWSQCPLPLPLPGIFFTVLMGWVFVLWRQISFPGNRHNKVCWRGGRWHLKTTSI